MTVQPAPALPPKTTPQAPGEYHVTHRVICRNREWIAVREIRDARGKVLHTDEKVAPARGAATEFCRSDMDRIACEMFTARYAMTQQAQVLRDDADATRSESESLIVQAHGVTRRAEEKAASLRATRKLVEELPAFADVSEKVLYEGKIVNRADVPPHRLVFASDVPSRDGHASRLPHMEAEVAQLVSDAEAMRASAATTAKRAEALREAAEDRERVARARGDACVMGQTDRAWILGLNS